MVGVLEPAVAFSAPDLPLSEVDGVVPVRGVDDGFVPWLSGAPVTVSPSRPSDLAVVIFTSGSTGTPKAVLHTQRGLATKALTMGDVHGLSGEDAVLMPAPMAHVSGLLNAVLVPGAHGMRAVLMERWDADRGLALMEQERISFMIGPPPLFTSVFEHPAFQPAKVSSMRVVSSGMMGVSPAFIERASVELGAIVKRSYGSTEAPTVSTCTNEDPPERCRDSDGRAIGEAELRVVDPDSHRQRRAGQVGEVWIRGPELFAGYADTTETQGAIHRGWFRSGDLGVLDDGGWLTITGRLKDLIIRGERTSRRLRSNGPWSSTPTSPRSSWWAFLMNDLASGSPPSWWPGPRSTWTSAGGGSKSTGSPASRPPRWWCRWTDCPSWLPGSRTGPP